MLYFVRIHFNKRKKSYKINQRLWVYVRNTPLISLTPRFPPNWWYIFSLFSSCHKFHYLKEKKWGIPDFPPILSTKCQKEVQPYLRACIQPVYAVYFVRIPSFLGTEWVRIQIVYVCNDSLDKTGITNNRIRLTIFHQNWKPKKSQVNLPVGTVPFYKEPFCTKVSVAMRYQGCGNNFVIQVKKKKSRTKYHR